jgi:ribonuclease HI
MTIEMFTDGLAEPRNPGIGTYAYVIYRNGELLAQASGFVGERVSNNEAEYEALIRGLKAILPYSAEQVAVMSDSQLLVNQMKGKWKVKKGAYRERHLEAKKLAGSFKSLEFMWVPREMNEKADALTKAAYHRHLREERLE